MSIEATTTIEARLADVEATLAEHAATIERLLQKDRQEKSYVEYETQRARSPKPRITALVQRREP